MSYELFSLGHHYPDLIGEIKLEEAIKDSVHTDPREGRGKSGFFRLSMVQGDLSLVATFII